MRTTAKLAASTLMVVASVLAVGCAGDQDVRRVNEPSSAPTETTRYGTGSYASPSSPSDNKGLSRQSVIRSDSYGSERGAKNPGGDINPHGAKSPRPDDIGRQAPESNPATPDVSPQGSVCSAVPQGAGHGSSGIKPGPMSGGDARTTDCPDWQESEQSIPGGRGTIQ